MRRIQRDAHIRQWDLVASALGLLEGVNQTSRVHEVFDVHVEFFGLESLGEDLLLKGSEVLSDVYQFSQESTLVVRTRIDVQPDFRRVSLVETFLGLRLCAVAQACALCVGLEALEGFVDSLDQSEHFTQLNRDPIL